MDILPEVPAPSRKTKLIFLLWFARSPTRRRLVAAERHHLGETKPDAGERDRQADQGARIFVPADQERELLLRCGGDKGTDKVRIDSESVTNGALADQRNDT